MITPEEWAEILNGLFPTEINGIQRPAEPIPTNLVFSTNFPQFIRMDPARYDLLNAFLQQLFSNDTQLNIKLNEQMNALTAGKNIKIESGENGKIVISMDGDLGINMCKRSTAYAVGDVAFTPSVPTWVRLDCTQAGTTAINEPVWGAVTEGQEIIDGTVKWIVHDVKHAVYA
jgi:hypothetical protein